MKRIALSSLCCLAVAVSGYAQANKLNQTVQVTNDYDNKLNDIEKQSNKVTIPDSLYEFNLDFDYTGFDSPYRGNDEFNPYLTELEFSPKAYEGKKFYLKAGAGYTLHPEIDAVWNFKRDGRFRAGLFAKHDSYVGDYWNMVADDNKTLVRDASSWTGYDGKTKVGMDARADWNKLSLDCSLWYDGAFAKDGVVSSNFFTRTSNFGNIQADLYSKHGSLFNYGVRLKYRYGADSHNFVSNHHYDGNENTLLADAFARFSIGIHNIEVAADIDRTSGWTADLNYDHYMAYAVGIRPRYYFSLDRFSFGVGAAILVSDASGAGKTDGNFNIFPSVKLLWEAVPEKLDLYVNADMTAKTFGMYEESMEYRFSLYDEYKYVVKKSFVNLGIRGNVMEKFQYDVHAGYNHGWNVPVLKVSDVEALHTEIFHQDMDDFSVGFDMSGQFGSFRFKAAADYKCYLDKARLTVIPPAFKGDLSVGYDYRSRINAYIGSSYVSKCVSDNYSVNGFVNLYAGARFGLTGNISLYLEANNLLNGTMQYIPMYAQRGISATVGIVLNF